MCRPNDLHPGSLVALIGCPLWYTMICRLIDLCAAWYRRTSFKCLCDKLERNPMPSRSQSARKWAHLCAIHICVRRYSCASNKLICSVRGLARWIFFFSFRIYLPRAPAGVRCCQIAHHINIRLIMSEPVRPAGSWQLSRISARAKSILLVAVVALCFFCPSVAMADDSNLGVPLIADASYLIIYTGGGPFDPPSNRSRFAGMLALYGEQFSATFSKQGYFALSSPTDGCSPLLANATGFRNVTDKIAMVVRGNCSIVSQVQRLQNAGAIAVLVSLVATCGQFGTMITVHDVGPVQVVNSQLRQVPFIISSGASEADIAASKSVVSQCRVVDLMVSLCVQRSRCLWPVSPSRLRAISLGVRSNTAGWRCSCCAISPVRKCAALRVSYTPGVHDTDGAVSDFAGETTLLLHHRWSSFQFCL